GDARPEERAEYVRTILGSADHLLLLIDDMLDFSKIEAGNIELERAPLHLGRCVELALEMVAGRAAEKALELAYVVGPGVPPGIVGDEVR
ncbi:histidine kinase dimerization/phospho-acceptor domain-containing protein, partial [Leadbetterella sp. DM7]|uniref:histidine kinase dimerization/phospho-acceptor domain-containing protein n=1 Tax=Leadbetterella sp. DM7 TaxID=3235085 RepID=UPI00349E502F